MSDHLRPNLLHPVLASLHEGFLERRSDVTAPHAHATIDVLLFLLRRFQDLVEVRVLAPAPIVEVREKLT
jgi:hypothetical protein